MACDNCPDYIKAGETRGIAYIVFGGGTWDNYYRLVEQALTRDQPEILTKWSCPRVERSGAIVYAENETEPPEIEGYQRDPSNPRRLIPYWPTCNFRCLRVWRADDGSVAISAGCLNVKSDFKPMQTLSLADCLSCAVR